MIQNGRSNPFVRAKALAFGGECQLCGAGLYLRITGINDRSAHGDTHAASVMGLIDQSADAIDVCLSLHRSLAGTTLALQIHRAKTLRGPKIER